MTIQDPRSRIVERLVDEKAVAIIRVPDSDDVLPIAEALAAGGISAIEVTLTIPDAHIALRRVAAALSDILLGAGSVLDERQTRQSIEAGAQFVVSPVVKKEVIKTAHQYGVAAIPGAFSPTEAQAAHEAGADLVKIFPAGTLGMGYLRALKAPLPHLKLLPTGGITVGNATEWLASGASAIGLGSALTPKEAIAVGDYDAITERARTLMSTIRQAAQP